MTGLFRTLFALELGLQLRSRSLWLLLILPIIGGVSLGVFGDDLNSETFELPELTRARVSWQVAAPDAVVGILETSSVVEVLEARPEGYIELPEGADVAVAPSPVGWTVRGAAGSSGRRAVRAVELVLEREARRQWRDTWIERSPIDPTELVQFEVQAVAPAPVEIPPSALFAFMVSGFLGLVTYSAATQAYTTSRQRRTRHTLGLVPVSSIEIHVAKLLVVALTSFANGVLVIVAWSATHLVMQGALPFSVAGFLAALFAMFTLALQLSSIWTVLAAWAPDRRTVSFAASLILLMLLMAGSPVFISSVPLVLALFPISGATWAVRAAAEGGNWLFIGLSLVTTVGWVWGSLRVTAVMWSREHGELRKTGPRHAAVLYFVAMLLAWFLGQAAAVVDPVGGLLFLQIGLIAGTGIAGVAWFGRPLLETLSLRVPRVTDLVTGLLVGLGAPLLALTVLALQEPVIPVPSDWARAFTSELLGDRSVWVNLLLIAVIPGVCEEVLFRGALLGLLREGWSARWAVVAVALGFGLLHMHVPRLLPTAVLGLVMGLLVVRTGSLWTAVVAHTTNNAVAVGWSALEGPNALALIMSAVAGVAGIVLLWRRR
jgi:membrane protease YdiL (CAAX protease family)